MAEARKIVRHVALVALLVVGCGKGVAVKYASHGDLPALQKELDDKAKEGKLDEAAIRDVSIALLDHDLQRFSGDEGVRRVEALGSCSKPIRDALKRTAKGEDDVAAAAAMLLVEEKLVDVDHFTDAHKDDKSARWRAVATRGLVDRDEAELRFARASDDDRHVRRAAIGAAGDAGCETDFTLLIEAARRDPELVVRVDAVRALGRIAARLEGDTLRAELSDRLGDLFKGGDDAIKGAVARAWGNAALFGVGGRKALQGVLGSDEGHPAVDAASTLMSAGASDGELYLARLANDGDVAVRTHALRLLDPMREAHVVVLKKTMADKPEGTPDDAVARQVAAEVLARNPAHRAEAVAVLKALLTRADKVGSEAAIALGNLGDESAAPRLVKDLGTPSSLRFRSAAALVRLGKPAEVRPLLTNGDVDVRDGAACAVLSTHSS